MRAAQLLATFALLDIVVVGLAGIDPATGVDAQALRVPLLGILAVTGAGVVALAGLSLAARVLQKLRSRHLRALGAFAVGLGYGAAPLGFIAWTGLWLTPVHYPVALAGATSAAFILWQALGEVRPSPPPRASEDARGAA